MNYNNTNDLVKNIDFRKEATDKIMKGVNKISDAVSITLGAGGKCAIYEDALGKPVVTKDGVSIANSTVLLDPVENIGANMLKQAAKNTVREAGDGTTTSTVLAREMLVNMRNVLDEPKGFFNKLFSKNPISNRALKDQMTKGLAKVNHSLKLRAIDIEGEMLQNVAAISCNNDTELGDIIGDTFEMVGNDGIVLIEDSENNETYGDVINGVSFNSGYTSPYFVTDRAKGISEFESPAIMIMKSKLPNLRRIMKVLEYLDKTKKPLLIIGNVEESTMKALLTNNVKGNIKVCVVPLPGFGKIKDETIKDLSIITGAKVIDEDLGDDIDMIDETYLGTCLKSVIDDKSTVLTIEEKTQEVEDRIEAVRMLVDQEAPGFMKTKLEERLSMLTGKVGIIYVGADSEIELKEKRDRVDDAVHATKAALNGGIVAGGGVALKDAAKSLDLKIEGERVLFLSIVKPMLLIAENAGIEDVNVYSPYGIGLNAVNGEYIDMIDNGIIDPLLVTESALRNAFSVAMTIISADAVLSNVRV